MHIGNKNATFIQYGIKNTPFLNSLGNMGECCHLAKPV